MTQLRLRCAFAAVAVLLAWVPSRALAAGALEAASQQAARAVARAPEGSLVVAAPVVSDQPAPRGDELALRVAALVAGQLGAGAHAHPKAVPLSAARALAGRASALVFVQTEIAKGDLRTTVDVYPAMANAWDRIRNRMPAPMGHGFSTVKIDAEVRSFLLPLLLEQATVHKARHDEGDVIAVGCGDVDGDGGDEIVLVSRARVALGRVRGGRFVAERVVRWSQLSQRAAVPLREPLAGAVLTEGTVDVGLTDRGSVALTANLTARAPLFGVPASGGEAGLVCLVPEPSAGTFDGAPSDCAASHDAKPKLAVPAPRFDAFAAATIVDATGIARSVVAVREPAGKLRLEAGDQRAAPEGTYGAQLVVSDLDQDGVPDVATSADGPDDAVNVVSWAVGGEDSLRGRLRLAAPAGVRGLAACPPEEYGAPVLVAVVGNEIWLVRSAGAAASPGPRAAAK